MGSGILEPELYTAQRDALRKQLRQLRRSLSKQQQSANARLLVGRLRFWAPFRQARRIAFYLPVNGEISPLPLIHLARHLGKTCFLPVIRLFPTGKLIFVRYRPGQRLFRQRWNIREPRQGRGCAANTLDMIFMPLTGFDGEGNRLGMGGGYYDRTLAGIANRAFRVGLAHDCQKVVSVPSCPWDISLHAAATPSGLEEFGSRPSRRLTPRQRKNSG
ncbi:5-formyltetrahydrofolate cyclo-ligase [Fluviicoccus keumensis]|uniref:5-formyltetrahydrofolate cyclo-ligase n=1 Tax=Fluviicoccus keumensis TaxID=1435465 RepID=A0A4Q7ZAD7_9GAMM|nr:5-formyltetrahydrofolate cyclo-ligase [Fluviicoccus keumensis]